MKVEVLFKSHRYEEFDVSPQTSSEPYRGKGTAILVEWNLYLGNLEQQGVFLAQYWFDGSDSTLGTVTIEGTKVPVAARKRGCAMLLVAPEELGDVVWLKKDGEKILWREGDDLINGERFFAQEQLCYSDDVTKSINKRALVVFDYLAHVHPDWTDADVAQSMGYTKAAIDRIRAAELSQDDGFNEGETEADIEAVEENPAGCFDFS